MPFPQPGAPKSIMIFPHRKGASVERNVINGSQKISFRKSPFFCWFTHLGCGRKSYTVVKIMGYSKGSGSNIWFARFHQLYSYSTIKPHTDTVSCINPKGIQEMEPLSVGLMIIIDESYVLKKSAHNKCIYKYIHI